MASQGLSPSQLADFHKDGYLIIPSALTPTTVSSLLQETHSLLSGFDMTNHPKTKFSTGQKSDHVGDDYFLTSGDKIRFFLEEDAVSPATGELTKPKEKAVNKIGHYLHVLSPPFAKLIDHDATVRNGEVSPRAVAQSLGYKDARCLQSMVICKQPEIGGAVPPHQDSTFLYTEPPSAVGFWYALEDATLENGCLSFWPGSHKWAAVENRLTRKPDDKGVEMVVNGGPKFPARGAEGEKEREGGSDDDGDKYVPGEVKAGDLVLIHGNLLHKSEKNTSPKGRIIYTFHIIENEGTVYDQRNWLQPPAAGFTKLYA